ncbi:hypothetical protein [Hymenobacter sp. CRA2]|uniref:hypothetical protein n=1 Tax=Hymenobacter sp. CRA2 TaxID=1955620 RepID=UPI00098FB030|nr:hypothetical protein [Hymenobacter sp. CRA2]OON68527.1 hypothetical protein B0919_12860 [Hymenobacter sp. CRA2]
MEKWNLNGVLNIYADLSQEDCTTIARAVDASPYGLRQIQFARRFPVSRYTLEHVNNVLLRKSPLTPLKETINGFGAFDDLTFLQWLPDLRKLVVDLLQPASLRPIVDYTNLEDLFLDGHSVSLSSLAGAHTLTHFKGNDKLRDVGAIGTFSNLASLALSKQRLANFDFLLPVSELKTLTLWQGKIQDLTALPGVGKLEQVKFVNVANLSPEQLLPLNDMPFLQHVSFYDQHLIKNSNWLTNPAVTVEINGVMQPLAK